MVHEFAACYQLFAALNLAYAGSERFRKEVNTGISTMLAATSKSVENNLQITIVKANAINNGNYRAEAKERAIEAISEFQENMETVKQDIAVKSKFPEGFATMFLCSGISCLIFLVLGGFESVEKITLPLITSITFGLITSNIGYLIYLMIRSYKVDTLGKPLKPFAIISVFSIVIIIFTVAYYFSTERVEIEPMVSNMENFIIGISLFLTVLPYVAQILRTLHHQIQFKSKISALQLQASKEFQKIEDAIDTLFKT